MEYPSSPRIGCDGSEVAIGSKPLKVWDCCLFAWRCWENRQDDANKFQHGALPDSTEIYPGPELELWSGSASCRNVQIIVTQVTALGNRRF